MKQIQLFTLLITLNPIAAKAQAGHLSAGGVGDSANTELWLRADAIKGLIDGDPVPAWMDTSGNDNDAVQDSVNSRPTFKTGILNGKPIVRFDGTDDYYTNLFTITNQNMTIYTVFSHDHDGIAEPNGALWQTEADVGSSGFIPMYSDGKQYLYTSSSLNKVSTFTRNVWYSGIGLHGTGRSELWQNGVKNDSIAINSVGLGAFQIAKRQSQYFKGDIAELIFYNFDLNNAQRIIVDNYLAAKYNLTIANDKYVYEIIYGNEVAGIGREDPGNLHSDAQGRGIVRVRNPSAMADNGDYLLWGHDNAVGIEQIDVPASIDNRMKRVWRASETGDVGAVTISFDLSEFTVNSDTDLVALIDADGIFAAGANLYETGRVYDPITKIVEFTGLDFTNGDYFTFASKHPLTTLKIIEFSISSSNGVESISPASIEIRTNFTDTLNPVTVNYAVTGGTATSGVDYTLIPGTATIAAGDTITNINIIIIDDGNVEPSETIEITLSNPAGAALGDVIVHTYTIFDNDTFYVGFKGPAGVGDYVTNKLWLNADAITGLNDGDPVSTWLDTSGNGNDAVQTGVNRPIYKAGVLNGKPIIRFDGTDDFYTNIFTTSNQNMTIYTVFSHDHDGVAAPYGPIWQTEADGSSGFFPLFSDGNQHLWTGAGWMSQVSTFTRNVWYSGIALHGSAKSELWKDGVLNQSIASNSVGLGIFQIAKRNAEYYRGDIAELLFYNFDLNTAQRIIVDNYLAAKYNITIANDKYAYESTHGNEVAGIGREDPGNLHSDAQGRDIVRVRNPSAMADNGDYLLWGHDNAVGIEQIDVPASIDNRMKRVWRASETGDVGAVTISFDLSEFTVNSDTDLAVLIDADGIFAAGATLYATGRVYDPVTKIVEFTGLDFTNGDYFTMGFKSGLTNVEDIDIAGSIKVYPNQIRGVFTLEIYDLRFMIYDLKIYDVLGREILKSKIKNQKSEINLYGHPAGMYYLHIMTDEKVITKKIICQ